jgi:hypothetical protein
MCTIDPIERHHSQQIASACCRGIGHRLGSLPSSRASRPGYDPAITARIARFFADYRNMRSGTSMVTDGQIRDRGRGSIVVHDCDGRHHRPDILRCAPPFEA